MGKSKNQMKTTPGMEVAREMGWPVLSPMNNTRQKGASRTALIQRVNERKLYSLALSRFKWEGFPEEVNQRWLEKCLMDTALAVYFKHPFGKWMAALGSPSGNINLLGDPTEFTVWGNGIQQAIQLDIEHCVPIWANLVRTPDIDLIRMYSTRLTEIDRTIEINAKNARISKFAAVPENSRLTAANIMQQLEDGVNVLQITDSFDMGQIQVLDLGVNPDAINTLSMLRARLHNEAISMLGINSANQDKKERLVAAEVSGNDDYIDAVREENLVARQMACEQISDMFGQTITVDYRAQGLTATLKDTTTPQAVDGGTLQATPARKAIGR
jgi:hypothetical protein